MNDTKVKKAKKWKYHTSLSFVVPTKEHGDVKQSLVTQLYQVGVYGIWNNNSSEQGSYTPAQLQLMVKKLKKAEESGEIKELVLGREITVTDETGLFTEVEEVE
jgi:hypothetical protein